MHAKPQNQPSRIQASGLCHAVASREGGFTLIELLVVISIIIVLMGLLFPAFRGVQDQAKKTQAKNDLTQLVTAVNAFYTEYGKYPLSAGTAADTTYGPGGTATNDKLLNELQNNSATDNPRGVVFLSPPGVKDTNNPRGGIGSNGQYYDPWGTAYAIILDTDYDNQISNPYSDTDGSAGASKLHFGTIAYSAGKDGTKASTFKGSDDVLSWQ